MRLLVSSSSYSSTREGIMSMKRLTCQRQPADANVAGHHALAGEALEDLEDLFALAEAIEHHRHGSHIERVRAKPNEMGRDALQLDHHHADILGALGNLQAKELLDGQAVDEVVAERIEVIHAV